MRVTKINTNNTIMFKRFLQILLKYSEFLIMYDKIIQNKQYILYITYIIEFSCVY